MLSRHFRVPGITVTDIKKYTGYTNVIGACKEAGVELSMLSKTTYSPLSNEQVYKVLRVIRKRQGRRFLNRIT
jgi:hypothetical protein